MIGNSNESKLICSVVQDLLPLYYDKVVLEDTAKELELHIEHCDACRKKYKEMCVENDLLSNLDTFNEKDENIAHEGYKRLMRKNRRRGILIGAIICIVCFSLVVFGFYGKQIGYRMLKYDELKIWYELDTLNDMNGNPVKAFSVRFAMENNEDFALIPQGSNFCLKVKKTFGDQSNEYIGNVYPMYDLETGEPIVYNCYNDLLLKFKDKYICIDLDKVAEELGLQ